jgi:E3 ubiquitin-protein ligase TRIP12
MYIIPMDCSRHHRTQLIVPVRQSSKCEWEELNLVYLHLFRRRIHLFRVIGQFLAKAMLDSRIIDMSFNKVFLKLALADNIPVSIDTLKLVDPSLAGSLSKLASITSSEPEDGTPAVNVADLALDFTLPGYDIELRVSERLLYMAWRYAYTTISQPGGRDLAVTADNVSEYISEALNAILGTGIQDQVKAFREGFSKVFSINDLKTFTSYELVMLFGNTDEDWSIESMCPHLPSNMSLTHIRSSIWGAQGWSRFQCGEPSDP